MLRFFLWRILGLLATLLGLALIVWFLGGGLGRLLRAGAKGEQMALAPAGITELLEKSLEPLWRGSTAVGTWPGWLALVAVPALLAPLLLVRWSARRKRRYVRLRVEPYRTDRASAEAVVRMFEALHKRLLQRWWRRLLTGQPSVALEIHHDGGSAWFASTCPEGLERMVGAALRAAYPNCRVQHADRRVGRAPSVLRLKKRTEFIKRVKALDHFEHEREPAGQPAVDGHGGVRRGRLRAARAHTHAGLLRAAGQAPVQATRGAPLARAPRAPVRARPLDGRGRRAARRARSAAQPAVLHRPQDRGARAARVRADRLRAARRGSRESPRRARHRGAPRSARAVCAAGPARRGQPAAAVSARRAGARPSSRGLWHLPSVDYATVPLARNGLPLAPAPPGVLRPAQGAGVLRDALGPVSIHVAMRRQNTAVPGTVEQGKSSYLVATVAEDLRRERCAVIVLDPKGDAAEAAVSLVPAERTCTLLDFARPDLRIQPTRRRRTRRRDRRLRGGGPQEPLHRCRHPRLLRPLPAQRDHRGARPRSQLEPVGRSPPAVRGRGRLRLPQRRRRRAPRPARVQGDLAVLHGRADALSWPTRAAPPRPSSTPRSTSSPGCSTLPRSSASCSTIRCGWTSIG